MNATKFLIETIFDLYLMVILLRIWLQLARADFYNPFSQFVVKATQPVLAPLRRLIPAIGPLDTAALLFAFAVAFIKLLVLQAMLMGGIEPVSAAVLGGISLVGAVFKLIFWVVIIRAILSWVSQGYNPIEMVLHQLTEPLLAPIRRVIPPMGGLDLSVMVLLIGLYFLQLLIGDLFGIRF